MTTTYRPGDIANGHVLGADLIWRPLPPTTAPVVKASNGAVTGAAWVVILVIGGPIIIMAAGILLGAVGAGLGAVFAVVQLVPWWGWAAIAAALAGYGAWRWKR